MDISIRDIGTVCMLIQTLSACTNVSNVGSVVVYSLFIVAPIICGAIVFGPSFVMQYFVSSLVLQTSRCGRESWLLCVNCLCLDCLSDC